MFKINAEQNSRSKIFWFLDKLKGSPILRKLRLTSDVLDTLDVNTSIKHVNEQLRILLDHASTTTTYYKGLSLKSELCEFPVMSKNIIRDQLEDFTSYEYKLDKCLKVSTSGSTGAPFSIYQNHDKVLKNTVDNIYFSSKANYSIGNHLVYIKIWASKLGYKRRFGFWTKNLYPCSIFNLSDAEIDDLIEILNKHKDAISFIGYASAFDKICKRLDNLEANPITFKTKSVITISESLNAYTTKAVKTYFGVYPLSRYSNNENGIIAQQITAEDSRFRINDSSYIVEIFDTKEDRKLDFGERGRIVVTDLYNLAVPMIRYDTGDIGTLMLDAKNKLYFSEISGRKLDLLYDTSGNLVPSHLSAKLCNYGDFKQFQLVQKGLKDYEINLNTTHKVDENSMVKEFQSYFGMDANISVNYVDDIPLLGSGKRREVVNEYYTNI